MDEWPCISVTANLHSFKTKYWPISQHQNSNKLIIGDLIQKTTSPDSAILAIGDDWSSAFAYHSQKRSFTSPKWPTAERTSQDAIRNPETVFGGYPLGAIISKNSINADELKPACHPIQQQKVDQWNIVICQTKS